jgi:RNA polymerase sigma-70 factor (ECF subfamily)
VGVTDERRDDGRTDAELLAATARGDGEAFAALVRRYVRAGTLLAAQLLGDADDAEDIVQDAFTVVHRNARQFDAERPFGPWFFAIVRRLASNRRARDLRRRRLLLRWTRSASPQAAAPDQEDAIAARLDSAAARDAMRVLSPMQRACFELAVVRGFSTEEIAAMHGISESTVRQHVFRARAALRDALNPDQHT